MRVLLRFGWISTLVLGMLFSVPASSFAGIESMTASEAYKEARQAYARGQFERALDLLRHAHTKDPKALYVYNMGRILEAIGRLQEAHETYLRVTALSSADPKVKDLSQAQLVKLKPLLKVAVLRFRALQQGTVVQVDKDIVLSLSQDMELKPGMRQVCLLEPQGKSMRCWRRDLKAGTRTGFPLESNASTRGKLIWTGVKDARQLVLDGYTMLLSVKNLVDLEVDVGSHMVGVVGAKKKRTVQASVIPGETQKIAALLKGPKRKKGGAVQKSAPGEAGIWPWVVTGVGGALVATGGVMVMTSMQDEDAAYSGNKIQTEREEQVKAAQQKNTTGIILAGVGVAAVAGGLAWWFEDQGPAPAGSKKAPKKQASWWITPVGFTNIFVGGRF